MHLSLALILVGSCKSYHLGLFNIIIRTRWHDIAAIRFFYIDAASIFQEVQQVEFPDVPNSLELSRDGAIITVAHGEFVTSLADDFMAVVIDIWVGLTICNTPHIFILLLLILILLVVCGALSLSI